MSWKKRLLQDFKLYAVTDLKVFDKTLAEKIDRALLGGVDVIQLRSKVLSDRELYDVGRLLRKVTLKRKKLFIVNNKVDLAVALEADGVHLGQDDLPIEAARKLLGKRSMFIGISTHNLTQAREAEKKGADYIGFGPIFGTPTKPTYKPIGLDGIAKVVRDIEIPVVCIGGINRENMDRVIAAGAKRVAVVRAIFDQPDYFSAARRLRERMM